MEALNLMESLSEPAKHINLATVAEIKQISVSADEGISAVNNLLAEGWQLLHIGHRQSLTVYVLGKTAQASRRRPGFLA